MIKTVQVEERRCICDICNKNYFTIHSIADTKRKDWVHSECFATTGKTLDICPTCADFLKNRLDDLYTKPASEEPGSTPVCSLHG